MISLADKDLCTGCGACAYICPKHCITMKENEIGVVLPDIDTSICIECGRCQHVCPILSPLKLNLPRKAYAAWSTDENERLTSASGGIAAVFYRYAIENGYMAVGASQNSDFSVSLQIANSSEKIQAFKNSKYVFSSAFDVYSQIANLLKSTEYCFFVIIALPCQIAALKNIFRRYEDRFLYVDIVCHGTTPLSYLQQHIIDLENKYNENAVSMYFRDPNTYTYTYTFTLYNRSGLCFCKRTIEEGDAYQVGYHKKMTYRENCYHCQYAQKNRIGDITLGDYHGLGLCAPCSFDDKNVSLVLVNTDNGYALLDKLMERKKIFATERPLEEPIRGEVQLRHPSTKTKERFDFEYYIKKNNGNFSLTMPIVLKKYNRRKRINKLMSLPRRAVRRLKRIIFK